MNDHYLWTFVRGCYRLICFVCHALVLQLSLNIIVYNDHLLELLRYYELRAHFEELITLLEQGINLDRAHQGIYTQLGVCYCKYKEEKVCSSGTACCDAVYVYVCVLVETVSLTTLCVVMCRSWSTSSCSGPSSTSPLCCNPARRTSTGPRRCSCTRTTISSTWLWTPSSATPLVGLV
mgnify:CR=1 FL=1